MAINPIRDVISIDSYVQMAADAFFRGYYHKPTDGKQGGWYVLGRDTSQRARDFYSAQAAFNKEMIQTLDLGKSFTEDDERLERINENIAQLKYLSQSTLMM